VPRGALAPGKESTVDNKTWYAVGRYYPPAGGESEESFDQLDIEHESDDMTEVQRNMEYELRIAAREFTKVGAPYSLDIYRVRRLEPGIDPQAVRLYALGVVQRALHDLAGYDTWEEAIRDAEGHLYSRMPDTTPLLSVEALKMIVEATEGWREHGVERALRHALGVLIVEWPGPQ
jgi:hypothetical protein